MEIIPETTSDRAIARAFAEDITVNEALILMLPENVLALLPEAPKQESDGSFSNFRPLCMSNVAGGHTGVVLLTNQRLVDDIIMKTPKHQFVFQAQFAWFVMAGQSELAIVINPDSNLHLQLPPEGVMGLRRYIMKTSEETARRERETGFIQS